MSIFLDRSFCDDNFTQDVRYRSDTPVLSSLDKDIIYSQYEKTLYEISKPSQDYRLAKSNFKNLYNKLSNYTDLNGKPFHASNIFKANDDEIIRVIRMYNVFIEKYNSITSSPKLMGNLGYYYCNKSKIYLICKMRKIDSDLMNSKDSDKSELEISSYFKKLEIFNNEVCKQYNGVEKTTDLVRNIDNCFDKLINDCITLLRRLDTIKN